MQNNIYTLPLQQIIQARNHAINTYAQAAWLAEEIAQRLLERLHFIRLQPQVILELGCATGAVTRQLQEHYPAANVIGMDIAQSMLVEAKNNCVAHFLAATATHLPLQPASIDLLIANLSLAWYLDLSKVLQELKRILKPGGLLMFTTLGPDTLKEARLSWEQADDLPHVHAFFDMHDIGDELLRLSFTDPVLDVENLTATYSTVNRLAEELKAYGAQNLNAGRRKSLTGKQRWQRFVDAYEAYRDSDKRLPASFEIIYGHAWAPLTQAAADNEGTFTISAEQLLKRRKGKA